MYLKIRTKKTIWILVITLMLSLGAYAATQGQNNPATSQPGQSVQPGTSRPVMRLPELFTVRELTGTEVKSMSSMPAASEQRTSTARESRSQSAENLGTVREFIVNDSQNKIEYVILESDKKLYPVPWSAFNVRGAWNASSQSSSMRSENIGQDMYESTLEPTNQIPGGARQKPVLYLNISKAQLQKAPTVSSVSASTESLSNAKMKEQIDSFYAGYRPNPETQTGSGMTQTPSSTPGTSSMSSARTTSSQRTQTTAGSNLITASKVFDLKLQGASGADLKKIENIVADARQGQILYALVNYGGFLDIGEKTAAVPWSLVSINEKEGYAKVNATRDKIEAAAIEPSQWYKLEQPQFAREIYRDFGVQPSTVYGFVSGEMTGQNFSAWQPDSAYNKNFDSSKMTAIKGTIRSVTTFEPASGAAPGVQLTVETSDGKTVTVYAGPQEYAKEKDFACKPGDQVEITGSSAEINNKSIVMASEVKIGSKTLNLYNSEGKPLWSTEQLMQWQKSYE